MGVELQVLPGELLEHVVRDDIAGLVDHPEPFQFPAADHHGGRLARPDAVGQEHGRLGQHPPRRVALMGVRVEVGGQTGQAQV